MQKHTYYEIYRIYNNSLVPYLKCDSLEQAKEWKIAFEKYYDQFKFVLCKVVREIIE